MHSPSSAFQWILSVPGANESVIGVSRYLKSAEVEHRARYLVGRKARRQVVSAGGAVSSI